MRPQSKFLMLKCMVFRSLGGIFPNTTVGYPMIFDVEKGGAMMFREIRKEVIPPLDHVAYQVCVQATRQRWTKQGLTQIKINAGQKVAELKVQEPINFQGQTAILCEVTEDWVRVDKPFRLKSTDDWTLRQSLKTAVRSQMHAEAAKAWNQFWQRDKNMGPRDWQDCAQFVTSPIDCPSMEFREFEMEEWMNTIKRIPNRSARGACGFSKLELLGMAPSFIRMLFAFLTTFEAGHPWPQRWSIAKVVCLGKVLQPQSALDCRPITVLSRIYRCWSSYRSHQVMLHLAKFLPPQVAGTSGTVSADLLVGLTLSTIEQTPMHESKFGCVLDLKKCYNLIPRLPMCMMLAAFKIPMEYIVAFHQMLQSMQRTFIIMNGAGDLHQSYTGIAEGCSFSVTCMCALSLFASWQITSIPNTLPVFFADNWSAITRNLVTLQQVLHKLARFADLLRMEFSAAKSWVWTSGKRITKALKSLRIQGELIPFRSQSVDLGCDVTYRGRMGTTSRNKRFGKAKNVLTTIKVKKLPYQFRRTAVKLAGHGQALYGAEVVYIPPKKWHTLRSGTASALGVGCGGSNPYLALGAVDPTLDPQFRALIRRIKFWRRAFRVFPQIMENFLSLVCNPRQSKVGPAGAFKQTFLDVGWTCCAHGWMVHHTGWKLHWTQCSRSFLHRVLAHAWSHHICEVTQHRKQMDLVCFDITWQGKQANKATLRQQSIRQNYMSGRHITNDFISKFIDGVSSTCKYCDHHQSGRQTSHPTL